MINYFEYVIKKNETVTDNFSIITYVNKMENRITFKIDIGSYLEFLMPKTINYLKALKVR